MPMPMPPMPGPAAGLPPSISPATPNAGPVAVPQGNQGNTAQALTLVRNALEMMQKALPMIPMGSPLHGDLLRGISAISKNMDQSQDNKGVDVQSLLQQARQQSQQSPLQALNKMHPAPTAAPVMPSAAPVPAAAG